MTTTDRLEALERLCEVATPGKWTVEGWDNDSFMSTCGVKASDGRVIVCCCNCEDAPTLTDADLDFIAASRTEVPWLIAQLKEAREALEEIKAVAAGAKEAQGIVDHSYAMFDHIEGIVRRAFSPPTQHVPVEHV